jgi:flagellar motility protein MotE (MotC chaperone)
MIKNLAIGGVVGLIFMSGGFWFGLRLVHVPVPKKAPAVATAKGAATPAASRDAISIDALKKTSEGMMDVNQALQVREQAVVAREKKALQVEDELAAERAALDRSHEKFHALYGQFQQRLQLVSANEADQLQRQLDIYTTMDPAQTADLIRALDDGTIVRLFSIMETKSLAKLVAAWKTKYPADSTRLLTALTGMGRVMPQDKMALNDSAAPADPNGSPAAAPSADAAADSGNSAANPAPADSTNAGSAPAADSAPEALSGKEEAIGAPTASPVADAPIPAEPTAPAASDATVSAAPAADSGSSNNGAAPAANAPSGGAPVPAAQSIYSTPDAAGSPAAPVPAGDSTPATPAAPVPASTSLAPPPDVSPNHGSAPNSAATDAADSPSVLGVPGATAAQAAAIAQRRSGRLTADISTDRHY